MGWDLRLGDCIEGMAALPDKSVAHTLMDPPYEAEAHAKGRRIRTPGGGSNEYGAALAVKQIGYPPITEAVRAAAAARVARITSGWALTFCQSEAMHLWKAAFEAAGAKWVRGGVYRKLNYQPQYSGDRPAVGWEAIAIVWCGKGRSRWNGGGRAGIWEFANEARPGEPLAHDGQKPLALMEALVRDFTDPGELVCDPFAGSGTTGVACKRLGRSFIGWERDPKFHAAAVKRLDATREQLDLAAVRGPKPKQAALTLSERCTCGDTYELGSGHRCPIHEAA